MLNILNQIYQQVQVSPNKTAFINRQNKLTYQELWDQSDALAYWIDERFGEDKLPVVVYGHKEPQILVCFLACVKAGRAYIPVDLSTPKERLDNIIRKSGARLVLSLSDYFHTEQLESCKVVYGTELRSITIELLGKSVAHESWVMDEENFYIIYTSGSTGEPKGVQVTSNCLASFLTWMLHDFVIQKQRIFLNQAPLSFDLSVMDVYTALVSGGTIWSIDQNMIENPRLLFEHFQSSHLEVWVSTPSFVEFCLSDSSFSEKLLPDVRLFLFCGETLRNGIAKKLLKRFPYATIYNLYGPTEATVAVTAIQITETLLEHTSPLPVGNVKPDCELYIVDTNGTFVEDGESGEIWIVGPSVSAGYHRNPEKTNQSFFEIDGKRGYKTGDTGHLENGLLFFHGRSDFQVKFQGYRIELEDIEENLRKLKYVQQAAVLPSYKNHICESLVAFVVVDHFPVENQFAVATTIKKELKKWIPAYMVPRKIIFKDRLPLTSNGKLDRKSLAYEV